jgi:hypothetical protein
MGEPITYLAQDSQKPISFEKWFATGKADRLGCRVDQIDAIRNFVDYPTILDVSRRLRTHQAIVVAPFGHEEGVVLRRPPK